MRQATYPHRNPMLSLTLITHHFPPQLHHTWVSIKKKLGHPIQKRSALCVNQIRSSDPRKQDQTHSHQNISLQSGELNSTFFFFLVKISHQRSKLDWCRVVWRAWEKLEGWRQPWITQFCCVVETLKRESTEQQQAARINFTQILVLSTSTINKGKSHGSWEGVGKGHIAEAKSHNSEGLLAQYTPKHFLQILTE